MHSFAHKRERERDGMGGMGTSEERRASNNEWRRLLWPASSDLTCNGRLPPGGQLTAS